MNLTKEQRELADLYTKIYGQAFIEKREPGRIKRFLWGIIGKKPGPTYRVINPTTIMIKR